VIAGVGQHDADVRERGLEQAGGDITLGEGSLEALEVVDLHHARGLLERHRLPDVALARHGAPTLERGERLVDRAVVAPVVHDDLGSLRDLACPADHESVRVGRGHRELPVRDAEPTGHLGPDPGGVLGRQHERDTSRGLFGDRLDGDRRGMAGHAARITEAQVDELVAVDIPEAGAFGSIDEDGMIAGPAGHPVHRHPEQERSLGLVGQLPAPGVTCAERRSLTLHQLGHARSIDRLHPVSPRISMPAVLAGGRSLAAHAAPPEVCDTWR
jgi:hypothetical protein